MVIPAKALLPALVYALLLPAGAEAQEVRPMYGGVIIDGYKFSEDTGPKGTIAYDAEKNRFKGSYNGLNMPEGRRAIFAWLHDTVNQKTRYLGAVGWLKTGTAGRNKGRFAFKIPKAYKGGKFGSFEIVAFSAEKTAYLDGTRVVTRPGRPAGSKIQKSLNPAFYLFAALPGADTKRIYCGHGQDFAYARAPHKQTCYDCLCGQKYTACIAAGLAAHSRIKK